MKRYGLIFLSLFLVALTYWFVHKKNKQTDVSIENPILRPTEKEKIILDMNKNQALIVKSDGTTKTVYLSPRNKVSIIENNDGTLILQQRTWGVEHAPILGVAFSDAVHIDLGVGLVYWRSYDLSVGVSSPVNRFSLSGYGAVSYNFRRNYLVYVKYGTDRKIGIGTGIRF